MEHESDDYTNCNWFSWYSHQKIGTRTGWVRKNGTVYMIVVYWPPSRPNCQNRKCTCVNNRCILSRNIRIWPWLSRGWIEWEILTLAGRRVDVKLLYNPGDRKIRSVGDKISWRSDAVEKTCTQQRGLSGPRLSSWSSGQLERRCWNEEHDPESLGPLGPLAPGWVAQENGKETLLWP